MKKRLQIILIFLLVFILIYLNSAITITSIATTISPYLMRMNNMGYSNMANENSEESKAKLERDIICTSDIVNGKYQYTDNIKLNVQNIENDKIRIYDVSNKLYAGEEEVEEAEINIRRIYINLLDLYYLCSENSTLQIIDKDTNEIIVERAIEGKTKEQILALEETIQRERALEYYIGPPIAMLDNDMGTLIEAEDIFSLWFDKKIENIEIIITNPKTIMEEEIFNIEITREIDFNNVENIDEITTLNTKMKYEEYENVDDEEPNVEIDIDVNTPVKKRETKAELGINVEELSTTVENNVQFTITLFTENKGFDLFKNPNFIIELPEYVETLNTVQSENVMLLNNKIINDQGIEEDIFKNITLSQEEANNKKYLKLSMEGVQEKYTEEAINNIQIIIPVKIKISKLTPTIDSIVNLYYLNENKTTYNKESEVLLNYGETSKEISFVGCTGILTETKIELNDKTITDYKGQSSTISVLSTDNNQGIAKATVINNLGYDIVNAVILGNSKTSGPINVSRGIVKYSTTENAQVSSQDWQDEYTEDVKSYLIDLGNFPQGEKVEFEYNIVIPEIEETTKFEEKYQLSTKSNIALAVQKNEIEVEVQKTNEVEEITDVDIEFFSKIEKNSMSIENVEINSILEYGISLKNKVQEQKSLTIVAELPENIDNSSIYSEILVEDVENECWIPEENTEINIENNIMTINVKLNPEQEKYVRIAGLVDKYVSREVKATVIVKDGEKETKFEDTKNALTPANIQIESKTCINNGEEIQNNSSVVLDETDTIMYEIKVSNKGETAEIIEFSTEISSFLEPISIEYRSTDGVNDIVWDEENITNHFAITGKQLQQNEEGILTVVARLRESLAEETVVENHFKVSGDYLEAVDNVLKNNVISSTIEEPPLPEDPDNPEQPGDPSNPEQPGNPSNPGQPGNPEQPGKPSNPGQPTNPNNPNQPENPNNPGGQEEKRFGISGIAWLDENKNGAREESEARFENITVKLMSGETVKQQTKTNREGMYLFSDLERGEYIVVFEYNRNEYNLTEAEKVGVLQNVNSDVYEVNTDSGSLARTDKLTLNKDLSNIDIGLVKKGIFDLKITKGVSKITVQNNEGTSAINYNNQSLAKVEIPAKSFIGTSLIMEYNILIENIGEVPGYAYGIADIMPKGTEFASDLNPDWYEENGYLYNISLLQEEIKPGEVKTLKVVLIKNIQTDEAVNIINKAEIIETFNEELLQEKDLNNNISQAEIIITIKTGKAITYILLGMMVIAIIAAGTYTIRKKVL